MKKALQQLIAENNTSEAIKQLLSITEKLGKKGLHIEVIMLSSKFEAYKKMKRVGVSSEGDQGLSINKINAALLEIIGKLPDKSSASEKLEVNLTKKGRNNNPDRRKTLLWIGGILVFIILGFLGMDSIFNQSPKEPNLEITSPDSGYRIGKDQVIVKGISHKLITNDDSFIIYILVHPLLSNSKWVQGNPSPPAKDGTWQQVVALGGIDEFEIWAIASDEIIEVDEYPLSHQFPAVATSNTIRLTRFQ